MEKQSGAIQFKLNLFLACYLNSFIQSLYMTPTIRKFFLTREIAPNKNYLAE